MSRIHYVFLVQLLSLAVFSPRAGAQNIDGAFRVGLETSLFVWEKDTLAANDVDLEITTTSTVFGLGPSAMGIVLGYGADETVDIGTRFLVELGSMEAGAVSSDGISTSSGDTSVTTISLLPFLEYVFAPGASTRSCLGATLGYLSRNTGTDGLDVTQSVFVIGALLGGHVFLGDTVSIDPTLGFLFLVGSQREESEDYGNFDSSLNGISVLGTIGISAWPGARPSRPDPRRPPSVYDSSPPPLAPPGGPPPVAAQRAPVGRGVPPGEGTMGQITTTLNLQDVRVELVGNPEQQPQLVSVRVIKTGLRSEMKGCDHIVFTIDGKDIQVKPLHYRVDSYGPGVREVAQVNIKSAALVHLEQASSVAITVCPVRAEVDDVNRYKLKRFVETFRDRAPAGTVPLEPAPAPGARAPAGTVPLEPAPAPGAAEPGATQPETNEAMENSAEQEATAE